MKIYKAVELMENDLKWEDHHIEERALPYFMKKEDAENFIDSLKLWGNEDDIEIKELTELYEYDFRNVVNKAYCNSGRLTLQINAFESVARLYYIEEIDVIE